MIAGDLGYGNIKVFGAMGALVMPSLVATDGREVVHGLAIKSSQRPLEIETEAGRFFVGEGAHDWGRPVENLDFDRFVGTPEMRALLYGALTRCATERALDLIVGLPLGVLSGEEDQVRGEVRRIKGFLKATHRWQADGVAHEVEIGEVLLASQADGTLFDYLLDDEGVMSPERKAEFKAELGILNIGMNTIDLMVCRGGQTVQRFTAGDTRGVRRLLQLVGHGMYSVGELDAQLRAGALDTSAVLPVWGREVMGFIDDQWAKQFRRFSRVIVAGGGTVLLREDLLRRFGGKVFFPDDAVISTARGLFKYARMLANRRRR